MKDSAHQNNVGGELPTYIYEPFKRGLPNLRQYAKEMWHRREFAYEMAKADINARHGESLLGKVWLVLNPLLLALMYFVLVFIIREKDVGVEFLVHLIAGVFLVHFISSAMSKGARSITGGGKLVINRSFPKLLLPLTSTIITFREFLPTIAILAIAYLASGLPVHTTQLLIFPLLLLAFMLAFGIATLMATAQVYLRDTKSFLPYLTRFMLYSSPVLYLPADIPESLKFLEIFNPAFGLVSAWSEALVMGNLPTQQMWVSAIAWSVGLLFIGTYLFLSREREFSVRI
jgi:teichoic acid transport system permease protein